MIRLPTIMKRRTGMKKALLNIGIAPVLCFSVTFGTERSSMIFVFIVTMNKSQYSRYNGVDFKYLRYYYQHAKSNNYQRKLY